MALKLTPPKLHFFQTGQKLPQQIQAAFTGPPFLATCVAHTRHWAQGLTSAGAGSLVPLGSEGVSLHHVATRWRCASSLSAWSTLERPRNRQGAPLSPSAPTWNPPPLQRRPDKLGTFGGFSSPTRPLPPVLPQMRRQRASLQHSMLAKSDASEYTGRDPIYRVIQMISYVGWQHDVPPPIHEAPHLGVMYFWARLGYFAILRSFKGRPARQ